MAMKKDKCAILFSGGTDSMCVAALKAEEFERIDLLTFYDLSNKNSPSPIENVTLLNQKFDHAFQHYTISSDAYFSKISRKHYFRNCLKFGFLASSMCAYTSMGWHYSAIDYCLRNNISYVFDGITNEMIHLPGHTDLFLQKMKNLYAEHSIVYENPVRNWEVPEDQSIFDRLIVDQHGFLFPFEENKNLKTTGKYLFEKGIFQHPNIKGSARDREMQHDCYPFVLYNVMVFWYYFEIVGEERFYSKLEKFLTAKIDQTKNLIGQSNA